MPRPVGLDLPAPRLDAKANSSLLQVIVNKNVARTPGGGGLTQSQKAHRHALTTLRQDGGSQVEGLDQHDVEAAAEGVDVGADDVDPGDLAVFDLGDALSPCEGDVRPPIAVIWADQRHRRCSDRAERLRGLRFRPAGP